MNWFATDMDQQENNHPSKSSTGTPDQQHIRLACQACQRKKIKCDRLFPCGQCTRSSLSCTPSTRKPRARHAGKRAVDSELRNRISKLESLVESLSGEVGDQDNTPPSDEPDDEISPKPKDPTGQASRYMSSNFWSSLTTEVLALREALEEEPLDDVDTPNTPSTPSAPASGEFDLIICPPGSIYVMPGAIAEPSPQLSATLCDVFCKYVDQLCKIFHTPALRAFMLEGSPYLGHDQTAPGNRALKATVWFAATNTMSESQCQMLFGQSRLDQLQQYKRLVDVALSQADLLATNDFATLQAFTVYIAATRMYEGSRRVWTLTAVAVRIAQAIGLNHETVPRSPYMTELRRRLWQLVRFLDMYAALDRGTEPIIDSQTFDTPRAKNTNDADFDENSTSIPEHEGLTDMSYAQLIYDAIDHSMALTIPDHKTIGETWQQRMAFAETFESKMREKYWKYCNQSDPLQRLLLQVSRSMSASMKLRAIRPLHSHISSGTPPVDSPYVLKIAVDSVRYSEAISADSDTAQYRWMVWVQWHALAVALAGLCSIRDTDLATEAWPLVEDSYARNVRFVADARNGMLWKPIEKLYKKASTFRDHGRSNSITSNPAVYDASQRMPPLANMLQLNNTTSSPTMLDPALTQQPLPPLLPAHNPIPGAMPASGVLNSAMDMSLDTLSPSMALLSPSTWNDIGNGDMSWTDFERMLEDMSAPANGFGTLQPTVWPQNPPPGEDWGGVLGQNIMM